MKNKILLSCMLSAAVAAGTMAYAGKDKKASQDTIVENTSEVATIIQKSEEKFKQLATYFQTNVADLNKVFHELNGQVNSQDNKNTTMYEFTESVTNDGGKIVCVNDDKIVVSNDPTQLTKNASDLTDAKGKKIFKDMVEKLEKSREDSEKITAYYTWPTDAKDPNDNTKTLASKKVYVVWGRKAFLGDKLEKKNHAKFLCWISHDVR